jgi:3''5''-cyclic nucleotide phosphodiesterase.
MRDDECNILQNLSREEFREFRTLVIDMVLATDMSFHFQQLKNMKNLLTLAEPRYLLLILLVAVTFSSYLHIWHNNIALLVFCRKHRWYQSKIDSLCQQTF